MFPSSRKHHITITDRYGNQIRGKVVSIQPKKERWRVDHAEVHITTSHWLDPYRYPATYKTACEVVPPRRWAQHFHSLSLEEKSQFAAILCSVTALVAIADAA